MGGSEQERLHNMMASIAGGDRVGRKLVFNPMTKTLTPMTDGDPDGRCLPVTRDDLKVYV